jgi:hypothetical protein
VRRRRTMSRKPAKPQHASTRKPKRTSAPTAARPASSTLADLQEHVTALTRERDEALEQLSAASEVLKVISSSPGDLKLVFDEILKNATRICEAKFGTLFLCEDDGFRIAALLGTAPSYAEARLGAVNTRKAGHRDRTRCGQQAACPNCRHLDRARLYKRSGTVCHPARPSWYARLRV